MIRTCPIENCRGALKPSGEPITILGDGVDHAAIAVCAICGSEFQLHYRRVVDIVRVSGVEAQVLATEEA